MMTSTCPDSTYLSDVNYVSTIWTMEIIYIKEVVKTMLWCLKKLLYIIARFAEESLRRGDAGCG